MAQTKRVKFVTNVGRCRYPYLHKPDKQFNPEGTYQCSLLVDDIKELQKQCKQLAKDEFGVKAKVRMPFSKDDETGENIVKVKSKFKPRFFDSDGAVINDDQIPVLFGGSVVRLGGFINPYAVSGNKGITLQLSKVQVIEPVSGNADTDGFDKVEGGYVAPEIAEDKFDDTEEQEESQEEQTADRF